MINWHNKAWEEYLGWQSEDKQILKKINTLIKDIKRNGHEGIGHPEPLKGNYSGFWSRRISEKDRLVYGISEDGIITIAKCKGHYDDK